VIDFSGIYIIFAPKFFAKSTYRERLRERPYDVLATSQSASADGKGANSYFFHNLWRRQISGTGFLKLPINYKPFCLSRQEGFFV